MNELYEIYNNHLNRQIKFSNSLNRKAWNIVKINLTIVGLLLTILVTESEYIIWTLKISEIPLILFVFFIPIIISLYCLNFNKFSHVEIDSEYNHINNPNNYDKDEVLKELNNLTTDNKNYIDKKGIYVNISINLTFLFIILLSLEIVII